MSTNKKDRSHKKMVAREGMIVLTYHRITDPETGELLEETKDGEPCAFLVGHQNVDPAYEEMILGMSKGDRTKKTIKFSDPDPEGEWEEDREKFPPCGADGSPVQGEIMHLEDEHGPLFVRVVKCDEYSLLLSTNEALAGRTVTVDLEVVSVDAAKPTELAAGFPEIDFS